MSHKSTEYDDPVRHRGKIGFMPRWEPKARDRLRDAALVLFLAHGFDHVTVAQITERAGLTRRTFSRYFTDKRDVLFAGSEELPAVLAAAVGRADPNLAPFPALLTALAEVGGLVADEHAAERRAIVAASPELQERGLTKFAAVTSALAAALEQRGADAATATLLAPVGTAIFRAAFDRWAEHPERASLAGHIHETAADLAASMQPSFTSAGLSSCSAGPGRGKRPRRDRRAGRTHGRQPGPGHRGGSARPALPMPRGWLKSIIQVNAPTSGNGRQFEARTICRIVPSAESRLDHLGGIEASFLIQLP